MATCQKKIQTGTAVVECGRPAACWWSPWQYCQDPPEPRCELHSRGGVVVAEMRGKE